MQAISKQNHRLFCRLIQEIRTTESLPASDLEEMESELCSIFQNYQQQLDDIRNLILAYDNRKKTIKNKIKQLMREQAVKLK